MLRTGLIGLGGVAERIHIPAIKMVRKIHLAGACDSDAERRRAIGNKYATGTLYPDAQSLLEHEQLDFVIIGTPPDTHYELCMLALQHGCHVFCEKPFVTTIEKADEIIRTAERVHRLVVVNNQYRYMEMYRGTAERIARGDFGRPFLAQCWQQMFHPPYKEKNWRSQLVQSTLFEFGTHAFDLLSYFFGALPISIFAEIPHPHPEIKSDVVAALLLRFPDESMATLVFNRISHAVERYLEMRIDCIDASIRLSLGGVARVTLDWSRVLGRPLFRCSFVKGGEARIEKNGRSRVIARERSLAFASATARNLREVVNKIESDQITTEGAKHARELLRVVFGAYESARTGKVISLT